VSFNKMTHALQERLDAMERAHKCEKQFMSDASHEVRPPLTALVSAGAT
jgi:signal transduction histidine kinase